MAIGDINLDTAQSVASAIVESGQQAIAVHYDQADEASIQQLFDRTIDHFGKLDGVFANAADLSIVFDDQDILHNDVRIWERSLSVNVTGTAMVIVDDHTDAVVIVDHDRYQIGVSGRNGTSDSDAVVVVNHNGDIV